MSVTFSNDLPKRADPKKKKTVFSTCFPCFSTTLIECDELTRYEPADLEYVVENSCIKRAPRKLVDGVVTPTKPKLKTHKKDEPMEDCSGKTKKDFSGYVVKKVPPALTIGPIVSLHDVSLEKFCSCTFCQPTKVAPPICTTDHSRYTVIKRSGVAKTYHAETSHMLDDDLIKDLLIPPNLLYQDDELQKKKVLVDIPKPEIEGDPTFVQVIPPDIKETIEALKVAKPLHISAEFPARNRKSLIRSSSYMSCDKETSCNFSADESNSDKKEDLSTKSSRTKRRYVSLDKIDASSSTSDFLDNLGCSENISSDLQSSDKTELTDSLQGQSLKWKIIINKHKQDSTSSKE